MKDVKAGSEGQRCTAMGADGKQCDLLAVPGTHPPRCPIHWARAGVEGFLAEGGSPIHDLRDIECIIDDLAEKQERLSEMINRCLDGEAQSTLGDQAKLFALHGQNASRLGRLLRDRRALKGEASDGIAGAIAQAIDELGNELGSDL